MNFVHRLSCRLAIAAILLLLASACGPIVSRPLDPVVKIGLVAPFEGRHRDIGYDVIYSARLAIREANERRGPGQTKYALVAVDDFGDPESARQTAAAMAIDPGVVVVLGHWLPETTDAARAVYDIEGVPFVAAGQGEFGATDPAGLDQRFLSAYEELTPFDETAGPYAGTAYDVMHYILTALAEVEDSGGEISRTALEVALQKAR